MDWYVIASDLWNVGSWLVAPLIALFAVPAVRFILYPISLGCRRCMKVGKLFGIWEEVISPLRYIIAVPYLTGGIAWQIYLGVSQGAWQHFMYAAIAALLLALTFFNSNFKRAEHLKLLDFIDTHPSIHPQEFFDHLLCIYGIVRHRLPRKPFRTLDLSDIDFANEKKVSRVKLPALIIGIWSTLKLARMSILIDKVLGQNIMREIAPSLACIWATRIMQLIEGSIKIEGYDRIERDDVSSIYLFTHKSFLDFIAAPLVSVAISAGPDGEGRTRLPLFLMARNHFRNNVFLYRIIGLGKAAEALGMIFVKRSEKGDPERAKEITKQASKIILDENMSLAIFPQGTRALPYPPNKNIRLDAGYYTVGSKNRIKADGKHLKKGAAFIAAETVLGLHQSHRKLQLVPIAIFGTSHACPKKSMTIRTNSAIRLVVGETILLTNDDAKFMHDTGGRNDEQKFVAFANDLHRRIDQNLKTAAKIHAELEQRFFMDIRDMFEPLKLDEIAVAMKPWRGEDYLIHAILDCIYTCKPKMWRPFLGELAHLLLNFAERDGFLEFKAKVAENLA